MERWGADRIREEFLTFFEGKGHKRLPSASLVPHGDPTLLLTGAGMVPFKPYFLGEAEPAYRRITTCQRCLRTPDIDRVGQTDRHATFFEMLGNFSFGDYFKKEAISWAWEFVVEKLKLPVSRLWVSVYEDDDEAADIWVNTVGLPPERVVRLGKEDNFWEIGVGPCGPCSEILIDRGPKYGCGKPDCAPGCDCDRYLEIWNLVFIQFHKDKDGRYTPLAQKGIDTGMGLERIAAVLQGVDSIFEVDLVRPILEGVASRAGIRYRSDARADVSLRVITDHMRGVTFLLHDGVLPGNEGRGYILRRLLRRAARHARLLGIEGPFLADVVDLVVQQMRVGYPELVTSQQKVRDMVRREEARFHETLDQGIDMLQELMDHLERGGQGVIPGDAAFRLYDTFGFPLELTEEIATDRGMTVDRAGFEEAMNRQRERARSARTQTGYLGDRAVEGYRELAAALDGSARPRFVGYDRLSHPTRILALRVGDQWVERAEPGDEPVELVLEETPFYPEGGGQVADTGTVSGRQGLFQVMDVTRPVEGLIVHRGRLVGGPLTVGEPVLATVDELARENTARHHTATHLLHQALRDLLGEHAQQAGSLVAPDRLRFDFNHFEPLSSEQLRALERWVNEQVWADLPVIAEEVSLQEAKERGAMMLFGEKYGERVRMISIGDVSRELCGGTHVRRSGELGLFKIVSEGGVAAGVRRIEAVAGRQALAFIEKGEDVLKEVAQRLRVSPGEVGRQVEQLLAQLRQAQREAERLRSRLAEAQLEGLLQQAEWLGDVKMVVAQAAGFDADGLRALGDRLRDRLGESVVVLASAHDGRATLIGMATPGAVAKGLDVGKVLRAVAKKVEGGGGGRPDMAQAGGRNPQGIGAALEEAREMLREQLGVVQGSR